MPTAYDSRREIKLNLLCTTAEEELVQLSVVGFHYFSGEKSVLIPIATFRPLTIDRVGPTDPKNAKTNI